MDAMPIRLSQQIGRWASQIAHSIDRILAVLPRTGELALGGTAVGTGINAHPEFGSRMAARLSEMTGCTFVEAPDHFEAQAAQDGAVELSGQLKTLAISLMKIANDLRWMNSGPQAGLAEIAYLRPSRAVPSCPERSTRSSPRLS